MNDKMTKKIKVTVITASIFGLAIMLGCASVMDIVTPAYISPLAIKYADVNVPTFLPYTSLWDARMVNAKMDYVHLVNSMTEDVKYKFLKTMTGAYIVAAERFQQKVFSPQGPIGLIFPTLFGGVLGSLLIKRPQDVSKKELKENGIDV